MARRSRTAEHLKTLERTRNLRLERQTRNRTEERALEERLDETAGLAAARGEVVHQAARRRGEARKPMRRMTGLQWLLAKGRLSVKEFEAGERYGEVCGLAASGDFTSCMTDRGGSTAGARQPGEVKLDAVFAKVAADGSIRGVLPADMGQRIVLLLEKVCGEAATVREVAHGDRQAADTMEAELRFGLSLLAVHFRISAPLTDGTKSRDQSGNERACA